MNLHRAKVACLLALGYATLTILFTYPTVWNFTTHHIGQSTGDAKIYLWNYWWLKKALFELGTNPFETEWIFYPIGIGLSLHTLASALGFVFATVSELIGNETASANLIILWTFVASGLGTYALARRLGATKEGAFLAGLAFAFCPYRTTRLAGHYDLLGTEWIPLYVLLLFEISDRDRFPMAMITLAGIVAALCGYTSLSYLLFLTLFTILFAIYYHKRWRKIVLRFASVSAIVLILMAPFFFQMYHDLTNWNYQPYTGADRYSADVLSYVVPPSGQTFFPGFNFDENITESTVFSGYLLLFLALIGIKNHFWALCASVLIILSLGSSLHIGGMDTGLMLPFQLFESVPVLNNMRAPSRFAIIVVLSLSMMMALAWKQRRKLTTTIVSAVFVAEYLSIPTPLFQNDTPEIFNEIYLDKDYISVVEIPGIEQSPGDVMNHQRTHQKPILVGTVARVPTEKFEYWFGLPLIRTLIDLRKAKVDLTTELLAKEKIAAPATARFLGIGYFVIDKAYSKYGVASFINQVLPVDVFFEDKTNIVFRTRRSELPPDPFVIAVDGPAARQHYESGWMKAENFGDLSFRWAHRKQSTILFRRPDGADHIVLDIAPLHGNTQTVSSKLNGKTLATVELSPGWQQVRWELPKASGVERLALNWSNLSQASERDPRKLAARVRSVWFE